MQSVVKRFPGVIALRNAELDIHPGEVHALLGENGAGKSTIIKVLSGVYQPDDGAIFFRGDKVDIVSPRHAQELGITTIFQEHTLARDLSPIENIFLGRELRLAGAGRSLMLDERAMRRKAEELWVQFGGDRSDLHRPVSELGGLKQRLIEIIKALAFDAALVIMDEPTAQLPDEERDRLLGHIKTMRDRGVAVLLVTHRLDELAGVVDRVTIFRDGQWIDTVPFAQTSIEEIIRKMVGREVGSMALAAARPEEQPLEANSPEILRVQNVRRAGVLDGISLTVRAGEVLGIGGLAGSGRTELVRAIIGADAIDSGEIHLKGRPMVFRSPADSMKAGIAMVPEERKTLGIVAGFTVAKNISISAPDKISSSTFIDRSLEQKVAQDYVRELRIKTSSADERIENLSGGNQQKVLFARAMFSDPELIIIDEPTQGIDVGAKVEVYRMIRDFVQQGGAAIIVSSELPELLGLSDRVIVMREGAKAGEIEVPAGSVTDPALMDRLQQSIMSLATGNQAPGGFHGQ